MCHVIHRHFLYLLLDIVERMCALALSLCLSMVSYCFLLFSRCSVLEWSLIHSNVPRNGCSKLCCTRFSHSNVLPSFWLGCIMPIGMHVIFLVAFLAFRRYERDQSACGLQWGKSIVKSGCRTEVLPIHRLLHLLFFCMGHIWKLFGGRIRRIGWFSVSWTSICTLFWSFLVAHRSWRLYLWGYRVNIFKHSGVA